MKTLIIGITIIIITTLILTSIIHRDLRNAKKGKKSYFWVKKEK